jgi:hypothetical protein
MAKLKFKEALPRKGKQALSASFIKIQTPLQLAKESTKPIRFESR